KGPGVCAFHGKLDATLERIDVGGHRGRPQQRRKRRSLSGHAPPVSSPLAATRMPRSEPLYVALVLPACGQLAATVAEAKAVKRQREGPRNCRPPRVTGLRRAAGDVA